MDTITLQGIAVWAHHGVLDHEAEIGQRFTVDVTIHVDLEPAASSDELADTVDYGALASVVASAATQPRTQLVEAVAGRVADAVLVHDPRVETVDIALHKPSAPMPVPVDDVVVRVTRTRP